MTQLVDAAVVKGWLKAGREFAFLDVREAGEFGEGHPLFAVSVPYSRLELDIQRLVPSTATLVVLLAASDWLADKAAERLTALGYSDIQLLQNGLEGWKQAGYGIFQGISVPSKVFGELVEQVYHTPSITATELAARLEQPDPPLVLDGRTLAEFRKMSIPGAICCPNAELPYRLHALVQDETTPVVINCAGRTRSIMGAQILRSLGVKNPVVALENGTQGWYLQGFALDNGRHQHYPAVSDVDAPELQQRRQAAADFAAHQGVTWIELPQLQQWQQETQRNLFVFDVRTEQEFAEGSLGSAAHAPGGQLLQNTDSYIGVRGARIVLLDTDGIRAPVVAGWLHQQGHAVYLLRDAPIEAPHKARAAVPVNKARLLDVPTLVQGVANRQFRLVDLRPSQAYRQQHLAEAEWSIRPRLQQQLQGEQRSVVLIADDLRLAELAAKELPDTRDIRYAAYQPDAWQAAGLQLVATPDDPADQACIDYLFFVHDRHEGNREAARQYLAWETGLVAQLDDDERRMFRLPG